jgi:CRP-like cAMP-binding protein
MKIAIKRTYQAGERLLNEGDEGDSLILIESGTVQVVRYAVNGREAILAFLGPGDMAGEMACLSGMPRTASLIASTRVDAHIAQRGPVLALLRSEPELALVFIRVLSSRLAEADALRLSLGALKMRGRLAAGLLQLFAQHGVTEGSATRLKFEITQRDIGAFAGLSRENVSRVLAEWRHARILAFEPGGEIMLRDRARLEEIALDED